MKSIDDYLKHWTARCGAILGRTPSGSLKFVSELEASKAFDKVCSILDKQEQQFLSFVPRAYSSLLIDLLSIFPRLHPNMNGVLLFRIKGQPHGIHISIDEAIENIESLWLLTREDFIFLSQDIDAGFVVELNYFDATQNSVSDGIFWVTVWGFGLLPAGTHSPFHQIRSLGRGPDLPGI